MSSTFELIWLSSTSFVTKDVDDDEFGIGTHLTFIYIFHPLQFVVPKTVRPVAPPVKVLADVYENASWLKGSSLDFLLGV
jgi:hypothetical protein